MSFELDEVSCLRILDHDSIDHIMEKRQMWREIAQQRWVNNRQITTVITSRNRRSITKDTVRDLHLVSHTLLNTTVDFKLMVSINQAWVYVNDLDLLDQLDSISVLRHKTYARAQIDRPRDTIRLQHSDHRFRTYFRMIKLTAEEKHRLSTFLVNQESHVRLSPSLKDWILAPFNRVQDYFFVDYATASWLTMLGLVHPGLIRKTLQIITDK